MARPAAGVGAADAVVADGQPQPLALEGEQDGDPAKLAQALLTLAELEQPPFRFIAGADALAQAEEKLAERRQQINAFRDLSTSLALDEAENPV